MKFGAAYQITEVIGAQIAYTLGLSDLAENDYEGNALKDRMLEIGLFYTLFQRQ